MQFVPRRFALLLGVLAVTTAAAQSRGPVPRSPLTAVERADALRGAREFFEGERKLSGQELDDALTARKEDLEGSYTYQDMDMRSLFPEIVGTDERAYWCFIALTNPQQHTFAYLSDSNVAKRSVLLKTLRCRLDGAGLFCRLEESAPVFERSPRDFFYIDAGVDEAEARSVVTMYREKPGALSDLNLVSKRDGYYVLKFGRDGCACWTELNVRIRGALFWKWLEVDAEQRGACI
jgi:hypothetical protein